MMGSDGAWRRWLAVPWSELVLAVTIVVAAAVPAFLVASVGVWRSAARDDVTARAVELRDLDRHGIDVSLEVAFDPATVPAATQQVREAVAAIPELGPLDVTVYTLPGLLAIGPPPVRQVGPAGRLIARAGALDAVEVVAELPDTAGGVWISTWFADRHDVTLGDGIGFEAGAIVDEQWNDLVQGGGATSVFRIVGLYEPLWSADPGDELPDYWAAAPAEVVPTFVAAFNGPNSELVIADDDTVLASGLTGVVRWRAPAARIPTSYDGLRSYRDRVRSFELATVEPGPLAGAIDAASTAARGRPQVSTDVGETTAEVERAVAQLDGPLASARSIGAVVGLAAMVAVGLFLVERRRNEFRLLVSEGEGGVRISGRLALQLVLPVLVGGGLGVIAALVGLRLVGAAPSTDATSVPWRATVVVTVIAWMLAAATGGSAASRLQRQQLVPPRVGVTVAGVVLTLAAIGTWFQVGRTSTVAGADVDLIVVALPVLVVATVVLAVVTAIGAVVARAVRHGDRLPVPVFLAFRRLARPGGGLRAAVGAVGLGVGLLVFAIALTATLDRTVDVKLASELGGASTVRLVDEPPPSARLPPRTTLVRTFDTVLTPGQVRARVIAVDPTTWAGAVTWPESFGSTPGAVLAALEHDSEGGVPAVAIEGEPGPSTGAFGLTRAYAFRTVARVDALPGAGSNTVSLLVSAPDLERLAAEREGYASVDEAVADGFVLPTMRFTRRLVSQAPLDELLAAVGAADLRARDPASLDERRRDPNILAARSAFAYLGVLGVAAGTAALAALGLALSARRRERALAAAMSRSMGMAHGRAASVTAIELATVLAASIGSAFVAVPLVVGRLSPRFDPAPDVPPDVAVLVSWPTLILVAVACIAAVSTVTWLIEWRGAQRPAAEVVRRG